MCVWLVYVVVCDWDVMKGCVSEGIPPCGDGDSALSCLCSACHMKEVNDSIYITSCEKFSVGVPQGSRTSISAALSISFHLVWMFTHYTYVQFVMSFQQLTQCLMQLMQI